MVFQALMKSCLLYMNSTTTMTPVPSKPRTITTFCALAKILRPNATRLKVATLAMVAMTNEPHS